MAGKGRGHHSSKCNDRVKRLLNVAWALVGRHHNRCTKSCYEVTCPELKNYIDDLIHNNPYNIKLSCDWLKDKNKYIICNNIHADMSKQMTSRYNNQGLGEQNYPTHRSPCGQGWTRLFYYAGLRTISFVVIVIVVVLFLFFLNYFFLILFFFPLVHNKLLYTGKTSNQSLFTSVLRIKKVTSRCRSYQDFWTNFDSS